jgi:type IV pilus assembly protein PilV
MKRYQAGGGLIEALISLVTISIGILGMIGMQAALLAENGESRVRMQAGFFATSILGMAAANPENVGCFILNSAQTVPCSSVDVATQAANWNTQVTDALPNAATIPPVVAYTSATGQLSVTLRWRINGDTTVHNYIATTQVSTGL